MSLNGRLESIPIAEILRLLARARKTGCLRVQAGVLDGAAYFDEGRLVCFIGPSSLTETLLNNGLVEESRWHEVEQGVATVEEVLADGSKPADLDAAIVDLSTDSLFRFARSSVGVFDFDEDVRTRYDIGRYVNVETVISGVEDRIRQWQEIESVIPNLDTPMRMAPELDGTVKLTKSAWRVLAALSSTGTVSLVANELGISDFVAARSLAELVRGGLVIATDADGNEFFYSGDDAEEQPDTDDIEGEEPADSAQADGEADAEGDVNLLESVLADVTDKAASED